MSQIDRIRRTISSRKAARTAEAWADEAAAKRAGNLPVPVAPVAASRSFREGRTANDAEVIAQVLGQHGERRGLRAGPVLQEFARSAYSQIEWSGSYDRRARKGKRTREI